MSFDQFPEVDRYSENEDKSNSYFRLHFSQKNGFLASKPEDKGCDFIVELTRNRSSTNWRFPVQIKSIEDPSFIENGTIISYSFEVSRLRYMLEPVPPVGLIILYWPKNNTLYYDYAEAIYTRLLEKRDGNMAWKSQEMVNIHIPLANVVDDRTLSQIHSQMIMRHQNSSGRSPSLYPKVSDSIPTIAVPHEPKSATVSAELLRGKGMEMYYNNEIPKLGRLLDQTPVKLLREDSRLSLLAGITYLAMGMPVDASFFLEKALNNKTITAEDHEHAEWMKLYLDSYLGKISLQEHNQQVKCLLLKLPADDEERRLKYELCIARNDIDLLGPGTKMIVIFDLANQFFGFNYRISTAKLTAESAIQSYLENVTNLGVLLIKIDSFLRRRISVDKKNGMVTDPALIAELDSLMIRLTNEVEYIFPRIKPLARNFVHSVMLAQCFESQVSFWLTLDLNALQYPIRKFDFHAEDHKRRLLLHTDFAKEGLQIFWDHQFYRNAYNMTLMLLELSEFAAYSDVTLDLNKDAIREQAEWLQQKLEVRPRLLHAKALIEAYNADVGLRK